MKTKQWIRKSIAVMVVMMSVAALCGCGNKTDELKPYEWIIGEEVVSYYDSAKDIDETLCSIYDTFFIGSDKYDSGSYVVSRDGEEIRGFFTHDSSVMTYKGICVGDNVSVIEESFSYEYKYEGSDSFVVYFDGTVEVDITAYDGNKDELIVLNYFGAEGVIEEITVTDGLFGRTME